MIKMGKLNKIKDLETKFFYFEGTKLVSLISRETFFSKESKS